jgi:hypothetical protein
MTSPARSTRTLEDRARFGLGYDTNDDTTDPATDQTQLTAEGVVELAAIDVDAANVVVDSTGLVGVGTDLQTVLGELDDGVADHLADVTDAHDASAISVDSTDLVGVGTDVQTVLGELDNGIVDHAAADLAAAVHGFKGIGKDLADGANEVIAVNEVKVLTSGGAGAEGDLFTLTIGANKSANIVLPAGGHASLTAATIDAAMAAGTLGYADADVVVAGAAGGPWTLTFEGANAATDIGNMTVTDSTGDLIANPFTVTDDGTGASVVGVVATVITVTGIAVGDSLAPVSVYATKAAIATQVLRAAADFTVGAGQVTVVANPANNTNNEYLFEWVDLT